MAGNVSRCIGDDANHRVDDAAEIAGEKAEDQPQPNADDPAIRPIFSVLGVP